MKRTAENLPRDPATGMPRMKLEKWLAGEWGRKKAKAPQGKSDEQKAYEATRGGCELIPILDELEPAEWLRFETLNHRTRRWLWEQFETHHAFGRRFGDGAWNLIRASRAAHRFCHAYPVLGRLACLIAKDRDPGLDREAMKARTPDPLALMVADLESGVFSCRCRTEAAALAVRHGV